MARCEECNRKIEQPSRHLVNGRLLCGIHDPRPPHERQTQELPRDRAGARRPPMGAPGGLGPGPGPGQAPEPVA